MKKQSLSYRIFKRTFDILFSSAVIVVGVLPGLLLSIAIIIDTKGFPIYSQERLGKGARTFPVFKFRSMVADADNVCKYLNSEQLDAWRRERKVENDPRITKLGHFLRTTSIDEFPQFINVLIGQMSIVGPRAITRDELIWYGDDASLLLSVPAGITGLWQTGPRNTATYESGERQRLELEYVRNACMSLDAKLILKTFFVFISKTGR